jgi:glycosyltransferase involved in cell wall biosynthesis
MSSVDVVVPCYRYGHFLRECVESALTQPMQDIRVLIIDDASPDNTSEVAADLARQDARVNVLRHAVNKGNIATFNEGIEWACADYFLLLSADDYLLPGALGRAVALMDHHPEVGFTFGRAITLNEHETVEPSALGEGSWRILKGLEFIELSGARNIVHAPTVVVRTELQKRLGGYRPELTHAGDMEMWLRFAAHTSVGMTEAYQAVYRRHSGNMSLDYLGKSWLPDLQQREETFNIFFQTCGDVLPNARQLKRKLFRLLACEAVSLASVAFNEGNMEEFESISEFAARIYPEVRATLPWAKLACKRRLSYRTWHALQPIIARIRK